MNTKKDYNRAVDIIVDRCKGKPTVGPINASTIAECFAVFFQQDNPRFDKQRFFTAVEERLDAKS